MELDDWDFSAEVLDSLERDALKQIAERKSSSFTTTSSSASVTTGSYRQQPFNPHSERSPAKPLHSKVDVSPSAVRVLPTSVNPTVNHGDFKEPRKVHVKLFVHSSGSLAAKFQYNETIITVFRNVSKASWNGKEKLWMFPYSSLPSVEQKLREIRGLNVEVEGVDSFVRRAITSASAVPDLRDRYSKIPSSLELMLLPFQRDGVRFVLQHGGRALIADEMGLGKTIQAIALASCFRDCWPVLVLTPSSLRLQWASMIQQWLDIASEDIFVLLSQWGGSNRSGFTIVQSSRKDSINLDGLFNIISYDVVPKLQDILHSKEFKVVIADESHFLKNEQAQRTKFAVPILQKAQCAILLSGTPALSRPKELFKQLEALRPDVYRSIHEYGSRYCMGGKFGVYQGSSNLDELHNLLKSTVMIRRLKSEVLSELPVKRRQQVFLEVAEKDMKQINALFRELEIVKGKIKASRSEEEVKSLKFEEKHLINKIYTDSAEAKIPAVSEYLETILLAGCKFIIFAHHLSMIDAIYQFLQKKKVGCIRIDGNTPAASRQALVTDFQEKEAVKAAVLSIKAGGVGLTLTAASTVIFAELSWTPGDMIQAEDRAHRIGQVSSVNVYYLLANDTVDDIIWDVVQSKLENLGQVLDGQEKKMDVMPSSCQPISSPAKQKTLDCFMKRCNNSDENQPSKLKMPRQ